MLARLQEIPGVRSALADASGKVFLVDVAPGVSASDVLVPISTALARDARRLTDDELEAQVGPPTRRELWFGLDDLRALSYLEGRLVAARVAPSVAQQLALDSTSTERLAEAVREEMFAHVERIRAGELPSGRFFEAWPDIARRSVARCSPGLTGSQRDAVLSALVSIYGRR